MPWSPLVVFGSIFLVILLILVVAFLVSLNRFLVKLIEKMATQNQNQLIKDKEKLLEVNQDLLNRMMSKDLPAYTTMTASHRSDSNPYKDTYVTMHDSAEAITVARAMAQMGGAGEAAYDDQTSAEDMGILEDIGIVKFKD